MTEPTVVIGVFTDRAKAEHALRDLQQAGFADDRVGYVVREDRATQLLPMPDEHTSETGTETTKGAVTGGMVGGVLGAAAALLIPGLGPAIAGGIITTTLGGAALGAAAGGLIGTFIHMGVSEEDARYYEREFRAGHVIMIIQADGRHMEAFRILRQNQAYDAQNPSEAQTQPLESTDTASSEN